MPGPSKKGAAPEAPPPIDADGVAEIASLGCTRGEAAAWFGVPLAEFRRRLAEPALKEAWARGKARGRVLLRQTQFRLGKQQKYRVKKPGFAGQFVGTSIFLAPKRLGDL